MSEFTIMIDTGCDLPEEFIEKNNLALIPIPFQLDEVQHAQGRWQEISGKDFYDAMRNGAVAKTSQINPETFKQTFTEYAKRNEPLLYIGLSSGLSPTNQNAVIAASEVKEEFPDAKIMVVDSVNASGGIGMLVDLAVKMRGEGKDVEEVAAFLTEKQEYGLSYYTVDDLKYLVRGGRVSKTQAIAGSLLGIKPILNVDPNGKLNRLSKARGRKASLEAMVNHMKNSLNPDNRDLDTVIICHADCEEDLQTLVDLTNAEFKIENLMTTMLCPVIGAHTGPGLLAMFVMADMTKTEFDAKYNPGK